MKLELRAKDAVCKRSQKVTNYVDALRLMQQTKKRKQTELTRPTKVDFPRIRVEIPCVF